MLTFEIFYLQVKDPEAEAEFEALRGLVEANLQIAFLKQQADKRSHSGGQQGGSANKKPRLSQSDESTSLDSDESKYKNNRCQCHKHSCYHFTADLAADSFNGPTVNLMFSILRKCGYQIYVNVFYECLHYGL